MKAAQAQLLVGSKAMQPACPQPKAVRLYIAQATNRGCIT